MKKYYRIMLGSASIHADECYKNNFIGADFAIDTDLSNRLTDNWRDFNKTFVPIWLEKHPGKSKISAGLACGALWTIAKGLNQGNIVLCPDGQGHYYVGEILDTYSYHPEGVLPHRRTVKWYPNAIERASMSEALRNSTGSIGTVSDITKHAEEIERLMGDSRPPVIISTDDTIEDVWTFVLEKHLEDFLVQNWKQTELGASYDVFEDNGEKIGQQYPTDTGPIDILAISKDRKELLVVELKKGKASDSVVGQIQRYMGYVKEELAENGQTVRGLIIALEDDLRIKRALSIANNIEFYRYQVNFKLFKG